MWLRRTFSVLVEQSVPPAVQVGNINRRHLGIRLLKISYTSVFILSVTKPRCTKGRTERYSTGQYVCNAPQHMVTTTTTTTAKQFSQHAYVHIDAYNTHCFWLASSRIVIRSEGNLPVSRALMACSLSGTREKSSLLFGE